MGSAIVLKIKPRGPRWGQVLQSDILVGRLPTMARPLRIEVPHAIYHVTSRGNARQRIVTTDADRQAWLSVQF